MKVKEVVIIKNEDEDKQGESTEENVKHTESTIKKTASNK